MRRLALVLMISMASSRLYADTKKLTEDQRIEILRGLNSEYAKIKVPLPRAKSALEVTTSGTRDEAKWAAAQKEYGAAGRVGDLIQVTRVNIGKDRIVLDLNGGIKGGGGLWTTFRSAWERRPVPSMEHRRMRRPAPRLR